MKIIQILLLSAIAVGAQTADKGVVKYDSYSVLSRSVIPLIDIERSTLEEVLDYVRLRAQECDPHGKSVPPGTVVRSEGASPAREKESSMQSALDSEVKPYDGPWIKLKLRDALAINVVVEIAKQSDRVPYRKADGSITLFPKGEVPSKEYIRIWPLIQPSKKQSEQAAPSNGG